LIDPFGLIDIGFFGNLAIESKLGDALKEAAPNMPRRTRRKAAIAIRKAMEGDELESLQQKDLPEAKRREIVLEIAKRALNDPKNKSLAEEAEAFLPEDMRTKIKQSGEFCPLP